jgi:outer membrane lipoprotein SlyB
MNVKRSAAVLFPIVLACGCSSMSNTEAGAGAGGLLGAGTGALIGSTTGHAGAGALIGAGVGAVTGGLIGHAEDESEKRAEAARIAAAQARGPMGLTDVVQLARSGVSDTVIISQIRSTASVFRLSSNDTIWLKQNGVSDSVIQEMLATPYRAQAYPAAPVYVVDPAPPPVSVGVGFGYVGHRW